MRCEQLFAILPRVEEQLGELSVEEAENLRRSVAMLPAGGPSRLSRETALREARPVRAGADEALQSLGRIR